MWLNIFYEEIFLNLSLWLKYEICEFNEGKQSKIYGKG